MRRRLLRLRRSRGLCPSRLFGSGGVPNDGGELGAKEVDLSLELVDVAARAVESVSRAVPQDNESNCNNGDEKEFHRQLMGMIERSKRDSAGAVTVVAVIGKTSLQLPVFSCQFRIGGEMKR